MEQILMDSYRGGNNDFVESVIASLQAFTAGAYQNDDITMLNLNIRQKQELQLEYDADQLSLIRNLLNTYNFPKQVFMDLCVMVEECFVNICSYAFEDSTEKKEIHFIFYNITYTSFLIIDNYWISTWTR